MKNCIILGCGRSGTSLAGGLLSGCGYFMGERLIPADPSNPRGYYESRDVHDINEALLAPALPRKGGLASTLFVRSRVPGYSQRWLARLPLETRLPCPEPIVRRIRAQVTRAPFCFKDPRFSYTLPAWRPFLEDTVFLCVFRHPLAVAESILHECATKRYLRRLVFSHQDALDTWGAMYTHVVHRHVPAGGDWVFLHYDQLLDGSGIPRLEAALGVTVDRAFADPSLRRRRGEGDVPAALQSLYQELCRRAGLPEVAAGG